MGNTLNHQRRQFPVIQITAVLSPFKGTQIQFIDANRLIAALLPNALRVSTVGDFNDWDGRIHQMRKLGSSGIFEIFVPGAKAGQNYKYEIKVKGGLTYNGVFPGTSTAKKPSSSAISIS